MELSATNFRVETECPKCVCPECFARLKTGMALYDHTWRGFAGQTESRVCRVVDLSIRLAGEQRLFSYGGQGNIWRTSDDVKALPTTDVFWDLSELHGAGKIPKGFAHIKVHNSSRKRGSSTTLCSLDAKNYELIEKSAADVRVALIAKHDAAVKAEADAKAGAEVACAAAEKRREDEKRWCTAHEARFRVVADRLNAKLDLGAAVHVDGYRFRYTCYGNGISVDVDKALTALVRFDNLRIYGAVVSEGDRDVLVQAGPETLGYAFSFWKDEPEVPASIAALCLVLMKAGVGVKYDEDGATGLSIKAVADADEQHEAQEREEVERAMAQG